MNARLVRLKRVQRAFEKLARMRELQLASRDVQQAMKKRDVLELTNLIESISIARLHNPAAALRLLSNLQSELSSFVQDSMILQQHLWSMTRKGLLSRNAVEAIETDVIRRTANSEIEEAVGTMLSSSSRQGDDA